jgi:hypothetical protein
MFAVSPHAIKRGLAASPGTLKIEVCRVLEQYALLLLQSCVVLHFVAAVPTRLAGMSGILIFLNVALIKVG